MEIKAKFKGKDGSEGYRNGETYKLSFDTTDHLDTNYIRIYRVQDAEIAGTVYYSSLKSFLNNWQVIS